MQNFNSGRSALPSNTEDKNLHNFSVFIRFKFSSVPDFYVPNKTQYKDYVEFIKNLPSKTDSELFDLDPKSQARNSRLW